MIPQSRGGANTPANLIRLPQTFHINFHRVFQNDLPNEQIKRILELNSRAFDVGFLHEIYDILDDYGLEAHNPRCVKPQRKRRR